MALFNVPQADQFSIDGKEYFRFALPNGGTRILLTNAPRDLSKCPRTELNRLVRLLQMRDSVQLPEGRTLKSLGKKEVLSLIEGKVTF